MASTPARKAIDDGYADLRLILSHTRFKSFGNEDTVLAKLRWYRAGKEASNNQWHDVVGILAVQRDILDVAYLRAWAEKLGVSDLLSRAVEETSES